MRDARDAGAADGGAAIAWMLRLALGVPRSSEGRPADWERVLALAVRERCAPLCWERSGAFLRAAAPAPVVAQWRAQAMAAVELGTAWLELLVRCTGALASAGVHPIVLKGLPLAQRLYGAPFTRLTADIDLFVPPEERDAAHAALVAAGWEHRLGEGPHEGVYVARHGDRGCLLEVHSSLVDDHLLEHLGLPRPSAAPVSLEGEWLPAHAGPTLPPYLAAHLAKHQLPPLLWLVDFHTLWASLDADARAAAVRVAAAARLGRYLDWAVQRAMLLPRAAGGDAAALRALGLTDGRRRELHNAVRVAALAATPADALRVAGAWVFPRELRDDPTELWRQTVRRLRRPLRDVVRSADTPPPPPTRPLHVDDHDLTTLASVVTGMGVAMWVRMRGRSMEPAIPVGARVRLVPLAPDAPAPGAVVLARLPDGACVLHRVRAVEGATVRLRGDANNTDDPAIRVDDVIAAVDLVERDGRIVSVGGPGAVVLWRRLRRAAARRIGRAAEPA